MGSFLRNSRLLCKHTNSTQEQDKTVFRVSVSSTLRDLSGRLDLILTGYRRITVLRASKVFCVTWEKEYARCPSHKEDPCLRENRRAYREW